MFISQYIYNVLVTISRSQSWSGKETLYRIYIRELDKDLCTKQSTLYKKLDGLCWLLLQPTLKTICSSQVLWQPLIEITNDRTDSKSHSKITSKEITRELDKKSLLNYYPIYISYTWSVLLIIMPALMFILHSHVYLMFYSRPSYCIYVLYSDIIFQILPSCSRPMTSCHVTWKSHASSLFRT